MTNEAAERLRVGLYWNDDSGDYLRDIDQALAEERRATVEPFMALDAPLQWINDHYPKVLVEMPTDLFSAFAAARRAILDAEASR